MSKVPRFFDEFRRAYPRTAQAYEALGEAVRAEGPLDARACELVKLGIAIGSGAEGAAHSHARRALEAGATPAELEQVALLAITSLGFARSMAGLAWIRDVTRAAEERP